MIAARLQQIKQQEEPMRVVGVVTVVSGKPCNDMRRRVQWSDATPARPRVGRDIAKWWHLPFDVGEALTC